MATQKQRDLEDFDQTGLDFSLSTLPSSYSSVNRGDGCLLEQVLSLNSLRQLAGGQSFFLSGLGVDCFQCK